MSTPLKWYIKTFNCEKFPTDEILEIIGKVLNSKIHERNLWHLPPRVLGYPEHTSWNNKDAFFDILWDCYEFAIVNRIRSIKERVSKEETADGFVFLNIKHFLDERQQANDSQGFAIFKNVENALDELNQSKVLKFDNLGNGGKIRNRTVCIFDDAYEKAALSDNSTIKQIVINHNEFETIIDHVATFNDNSRRIVTKLILYMKAAGIAAFLVGNLVDTLKDVSKPFNVEIPILDNTSDSSKVFQQLEVSLNDANAADDASVDIIKVCNVISNEIDKLKKQKKVKSRLHCLLNAIMCSTAEGKDPNFAVIAKEMGKSRSTISEDWTLLKSLAIKK